MGTARKPLVVVSGEIQQLTVGDYLNIPISGVNEISMVNDNAGAIVMGTPVYVSAAGHVDKAKADAAGTTKVIGLVSEASIAAAASGVIGVDGILSTTTALWDAVTGQVGGLTAGSYYFLDPATAGKLTVTAPTTVGQYVVRIGIAISTTEMRLVISDRILL